MTITLEKIKGNEVLTAEANITFNTWIRVEPKNRLTLEKKNRNHVRITEVIKSIDM